MKHPFLAIIVGLLATVAQSAQINWGATGQIKFDNAVVGKDNVTLSLVCLSGITEDWATYAVSVADGSETGNVVATKKTNAGSQSAPTASPYGFTFSDTTSIPSKTYVSGTLFAMIATTVQDGKTYYWASDTYSVTDSGSNWNSTSQTYTMNVASSTINNSWTAVPEPSTAALALAGLALLIKRRRA